MSAHVSLNLLNELGKEIKCEVLSYKMRGTEHFISFSQQA